MGCASLAPLLEPLPRECAGGGLSTTPSGVWLRNRGELRHDSARRLSATPPESRARWMPLPRRATAGAAESILSRGCQSHNTPYAVNLDPVRVSGTRATRPTARGDRCRRGPLVPDKRVVTP
jgi:hypothetical protein